MINILFIDDNRQAGLLGKIYLEKYGFHVLVARETIKARSYLNKNKIDFIIVDIGMPGESGIDFYQWLKAQESYKNIPVCLVSAHAFSLGKLNNDDTPVFFEKPIFFPKLIDHIKNTLGVM